jgi:hypothetical protein
MPDSRFLHVEVAGTGAGKAPLLVNASPIASPVDIGTGRRRVVEAIHAEHAC